MILEFSVGNFRSIKDIQTISFVASPIVSKNKEIDENNTFQATDKIRLLKSLAIYGANASGKSNFVMALRAFMRIGIDSVKDEIILSLIHPFLLSDETENKPCYFQIVFILNNMTYRYGFEATNSEIISEWLFSKKHDISSRESNVFIREKQLLDINDKALKSIRKFKNLINNDNPVFRKNSLFLTALAAFNEDLSKSFINYFENISSLGGLSDRSLRRNVDELISNNVELRDEVLKMLRESDTNIVDIKAFEPSELNMDLDTARNYNNIANAGDKKILITYHKKNSAKKDEVVMFYLDAQASEGTRKMYEIYPFVFYTLKFGTLLIIDEFDARFHPKLSQKIIDLFNNPKTNPKNAQILVVTHDTNLLSSKTFRRDQILFVEKDKNEASHIYALAEFKGVRNDASFEKDYLDGRYGAVPILNNFTSIFENQD
jgi:uncharacterized protein